MKRFVIIISSCFVLISLGLFSFNVFNNLNDPSTKYNINKTSNDDYNHNKEIDNNNDIDINTKEQEVDNIDKDSDIEKEYIDYVNNLNDITTLPTNSYNILLSSDEYNLVFSLDKSNNNFDIHKIADVNDHSFDNYVYLLESQLNYIFNNKDFIKQEVINANIFRKYSMVNETLNSIDTDLTESKMITMLLNYISNM